MKPVLFATAIAAVLLAGLLAAGCARPVPAPEPALPGVDVRRYDLMLQLDPAERRIAGWVRIDVQYADTVSRLPLLFSGLGVDSVRVDGVPVAAVRSGEYLVVPLPKGRGASVVEVSYAGVPPEGLYRGEHQGLPVVYTDSWPDRVRGWMPGVHHPTDPAAFTLTLDVPEGYEAVGSGAPAPVERLDGGRRYRWDLDAAAPTYTFAFAVSDFSVTEAVLGDTLPIRYYMLAPDSAFAAELVRTPQMLGYFSELLGPYAFDHYASVEVPFGFAGMENASASFLQARLFGRSGAEETQVHEVAHQWFGNRVVVADWRDLWISEGFATYLTTLFYEHADGVDAARERWAAMAAWTGGRRTGRPHVLVPPPPVEPTEHLTWVPYQKGASVLHLLRLRLGDDAFFRALRETYRRYEGRPLSTEVFHRLLERTSGEGLDAVFDYWVYGGDLPRLDVVWDPAARRLTWTVRGDAGTLDDVPFLLQVRQEDRTVYVPAADGEVTLPAWTTRAPDVRPVGVMMDVHAGRKAE